MKRFQEILIGVVAVSFVLSLSLQAADHKYVGAIKCKICHMNKKKGDQFGAWQASKHAKAFETLSTPAAKEVGTKAGVANTAADPKCLKCHLTAFDAPAAQKDVKYSQAEGVTCETCHGPGSDYSPLKVMKDRAASVAAGLILPEKSTCVKCHNQESPTFKSFDCAAMWAKIAHDDPEIEGGSVLKGCP
ncbi:MAG TPA: cytochrome c family protein [Candidatus Glassbacteria bacterium]|nr:cytochrome c family protein [Candidatus Glassbacteria bacterium]